MAAFDDLWTEAERKRTADCAERWKAATREVKTKYFEHLVYIEKAGLNYVLLRRQKKELQRQSEDVTKELVFYWKALWGALAVLAVAEYFILGNLRGYFAISLLFYLLFYHSNNLKLRLLGIELAKLDREIKIIVSDKRLARLLFGRKYEEFFEKKAFGTGEEEGYEAKMLLERERLKVDVFNDVTAEIKNPFELLGA